MLSPLDPSEAASLSPMERVQTILDRTFANTYHTAESVAANEPIYDELRMVPGYGELLLALARQEHPTRRDRAVDAATGLRVPGVVDLLLDGSTDVQGGRATEPRGPQKMPSPGISVGDHVGVVGLCPTEPKRQGLGTL